MPGIVWDNISSRNYESGLDRGVLYLPDNSAVPWNGLVSVTEKFNREVKSIYYDGVKVNDIVSSGEFSASLKAVTYPDEFVTLEGLGTLKTGVYLGDQKPKRFGLSYRTQIGNELNGPVSGYKLHIIYNVLAVPIDIVYQTVTTDPNIIEFEWNITAIPEVVQGFVNTAHLIFNSLDIDPWLLEDIEDILYGSESSSAELISMFDLISLINEWHRITITDNGDGTWTAISVRDGFINIDEAEQLFTIDNINSTYLNETTYEISDTG